MSSGGEVEQWEGGARMRGGVATTPTRYGQGSKLLEIGITRETNGVMINLALQDHTRIRARGLGLGLGG